MAGKSFINEALKENLIQDMEKRTSLEKEIANHIDDFMDSISSATIYSLINLILKNGHPQQKRHMREIQDRYENSGLLLDDTLYLLDIFEKKYNELFEDDEI